MLSLGDSDCSFGLERIECDVCGGGSALESKGLFPFPELAVSSLRDNDWCDGLCRGKGCYVGIFGSGGASDVELEWKADAACECGAMNRELEVLCALSSRNASTFD
eukprot:TRINITY_DN22679_c0_g1_i1.p3 TRINITY_DN22679_c0_g1~~TRINITY_DN22679_c0_g1_i1.p3  ORF type:complete len:106 (+),score=10.28 TRINITY_DN22679_c0_g1_i1:450-767(+)